MLPLGDVSSILVLKIKLPESSFSDHPMFRQHKSVSPPPLHPPSLTSETMSTVTTLQ